MIALSQEEREVGGQWNGPLEVAELAQLRSEAPLCLLRAEFPSIAGVEDRLDQVRTPRSYANGPHAGRSGIPAVTVDISALLKGPDSDESSVSPPRQVQRAPQPPSSKASTTPPRKVFRHKISYTISQDHTAGDSAHRSYLLSRLGRKTVPGHRLRPRLARDREPPPSRPQPAMPSFNLDRPQQERKAPTQASSYWSMSESIDFPHLLRAYGSDWTAIAAHMGSKTAVMVKNFFVRQKDQGKAEWEAIVQEADGKRMRGEARPDPPRHQMPGRYPPPGSRGPEPVLPPAQAYPRYASTPGPAPPRDPREMPGRSYTPVGYDARGQPPPAGLGYPGPDPRDMQMSDARDPRDPQRRT
ncbi:hypothetical protein ACJZ2D_016706 [Fusarium nematophilum]